MMGRSHLVAGTAYATVLFSGVTWFSQWDGHVGPWGFLAQGVAGQGSESVFSVAQAASRAVLDRLTPDGTMQYFVLGPLMAMVFWIGCLAPDIDSRRSMLGRRLYVPVRHRGWTHTDWTLGALIALSVVDITGLVAWFTIGVSSHLVLDEMSVAGRVHFYPLTAYKVYLSPAGDEIVVKRRWRGLYKTGSVAERVVVAVLLLSAAVSVWLVWF